ncbi:MAG TPA: hypothetical protein VML55_09850, partial [Planctomycetaceae bacterium]|nr:hypothetical protein [Planctomycetaceae bacterium]
MELELKPAADVPRREGSRRAMAEGGRPPADSTVRSAAQPPRRVLALAAGLPSTVLMQTGLELYRKNLHELSAREAQVLLLLAGIAAVAWLAIFALLCRGRTAGRVVWLLACSFAVWFVVRDVAFPLPLGEFDGAQVLEPLSGGYVALEALVLIAAAAAMLRLRGQATAVVALLTGIFLVTNVTAAVRVVRKSVRLARSESEIQAALSAVPRRSGPLQSDPLAGRPDVYQILFDTYQSVEFELSTRQQGLGAYEDFIFYCNNISNYNYTYLSLPSLMTSTVYDDGSVDVHDWHSSYKRSGLLRALKRADYRVRAYGHDGFWWQSPLVDFSRCSLEIAREWQADRV